MGAILVSRMCIRLHADGRGFDPRVRQHSFVKICHEIISTAILSLLLIQVGGLENQFQTFVIVIKTN